MAVGFLGSEPTVPEKKTEQRNGQTDFKNCPNPIPSTENASLP